MAKRTRTNASPPTGPAEDLGFDPELLRQKYRIERDKRIRTDANDQYVEVVGDFSYYVEDPYVDPGFTREPLDDEVDVVVVGGGIGGLLIASKLRAAGVQRIRVIEKGGDFGGTWYWNRYPGACCDVEAYIYLPLLEEMEYIPSMKYTFQPEILTYLQSIGRKFDLYRDACFQTSVTELRWDEADAQWVISTDRGDRIKARFVAPVCGPLSRPKLPGIPGIKAFKGHTFHTSRWDYQYTGGDATGNLTGLADKRVGIIGTGATAIQCGPHLGASAKQLYVFQRTPSTVNERNNRPTDPKWAKSLQPGWQKRRMQNFNIIVSGGDQEEDLVGDAWTHVRRDLAVTVANANTLTQSSEQEAAMELADFQKMEEIRARVDAVVTDRATAEALKPWYRMFCKRACFSDEYLISFNRANVTLVDTQGKGVERVTENGVVVDGKEYELDCLIFSTGFEVGTEYTRQTGYDVIGRAGVKLSDKWSNGFRTFHGCHSHGFPNCFFLGSTQTGLTPNYPHTLTEQCEHVASIIADCMKNDEVTIEATQSAEDEWVDTIRRLAVQNQKFLQECTPSYYNSEGNVGNSFGPLASQYGGGSEAFFNLLREWREEGNRRGLVTETRTQRASKRPIDAE